MTERILNFEILMTLLVAQKDAEGISTPTDADDVPVLEIVRNGVPVNTAEVAVVLAPESGTYTCAWTPTAVGLHVLTWTFLVGGVELTSTERVDVVSDAGGTSDSSLPAETVPTIPDLGESKTCRVVGQFYDASGNGIPGIFVRFTPDHGTTSFLSSGVVAAEVTTVSDAAGVIELYLVRGITGMLAITGVGIVRHVTIPSTGRIDIRDLADSGDDLLTVQTPKFYMLPRRS